MRENRTSGSEGGEAQTNGPSLPLSVASPAGWRTQVCALELPSPGGSLLLPVGVEGGVLVFDPRHAGQAVVALEVDESHALGGPADDANVA